MRIPCIHEFNVIMIRKYEIGMAVDTNRLYLPIAIDIDDHKELAFKVKNGRKKKKLEVKCKYNRFFFVLIFVHSMYISVHKSSNT